MPSCNSTLVASSARAPCPAGVLIICTARLPDGTLTYGVASAKRSAVVTRCPSTKTSSAGASGEAWTSRSSAIPVAPAGDGAGRPPRRSARSAPSNARPTSRAANALGRSIPVLLPLARSAHRCGRGSDPPLPEPLPPYRSVGGVIATGTFQPR